MGKMVGSRFARPLLGRLMKAGFARRQRGNRDDSPTYPAGALIAEGGGRPAADGRLPTGVRLFDLFRGSHFTVLGPGPVPGLDREFAHVHRLPSARRFTVVRPDGYVALVADRPEPVRDYFDRLGAPAPSRV